MVKSDKDPFIWRTSDKLKQFGPCSMKALTQYPLLETYRCIILVEGHRARKQLRILDEVIGT